MNVLDFARRYNEIIETNPCIPILYHATKPHQVGETVQKILRDSEYDVEFTKDQSATYMRCRQISDKFYPIKCSSIFKNGGNRWAFFKQITSKQREYDYFYGIYYDETKMYFTLIPMIEEEMKEFKLEWENSNHRGSDGLNFTISTSRLVDIYNHYNGGKINHTELCDKEVEF